MKEFYIKIILSLLVTVGCKTLKIIIIKIQFYLKLIVRRTTTNFSVVLTNPNNLIILNLPCERIIFKEYTLLEY